MRQSRYTICCKLDENEYALYNTATGHFAVCGNRIASIFAQNVGPSYVETNEGASTFVGANECVCVCANAGAGANTIEGAGAGEGAGEVKGAGVGEGVSTAPLTSDELEILTQAGFLVEDTADELAAQERIFQAQRQDKKLLWLALAPTYACNCRCAYCYEQDKMTAKSLMSEEVIQSVFAFVEERFAANNFESLFVEWYGGDPQLCLDLVKRVSNQLIDFCNAHRVHYDSMMLSNSSRIGAPEAKLLAQSKVSSMLITIDGPEDLHNVRRPAVDIENPYAAIMDAIKQLQQNGIAVSVMMNTDKVNLARADELRCVLDPLGIELSLAKLNDYARSFNHDSTGRFCQPHFDLYTHEEFAHASYAYQKEHGFTRDGLAALLSPADHFCSGQRDESYVIDAFGDVYKCDGWMGDKRRSVFNLLDAKASNTQGHDEASANAHTPDVAMSGEEVSADAHTHSAETPGDKKALDAAAPSNAHAYKVEAPGNPYHQITFDPFGSAKCRNCSLLPLCWGNCSWERERCNWPCHPLTHTMPDYLQSYREFFPKRTQPLEVLK